MPSQSPPADRATAPTVIRLDFEQFLAAGDQWDALNAESASPSPFVGHTWLKLWWRHFGENMEFRALVAQADGRWVAAVPLVVRRRRWAGVPLRIVEFAGTSPVPTRGMGLADRADAFAVADDPGAVTAFAGELRNVLAEAEALDLKGVGAHSPTNELAGGLAAGRGVRLDRSRSPYLKLPPTWDEYVASRSGNFRRQQRKFRRNLEREGEVEIVRLGAGDDPAPWIETVVAVNTASWKGERGTNLFRHAAIRAFLTDLIAEAGSRDAIDLHVLRVGGHPVAYELCFDLAGRLFSYNSGFRSEFARFAPGYVLTAAVIEAGIARGCTEYDLLRGAEEYKLRWTRTTRDEVEWIVPGSGPRAWGLGRSLELKHRLKNSPRLSDAADRATGLFGRLFH